MLILLHTVNSLNNQIASIFNTTNYLCLILYNNYDRLRHQHPGRLVYLLWQAATATLRQTYLSTMRGCDSNTQADLSINYERLRQQHPDRLVYRLWEAATATPRQTCLLTMRGCDSNTQADLSKPIMIWQRTSEVGWHYKLELHHCLLGCS